MQRLFLAKYFSLKQSRLFINLRFFFIIQALFTTFLTAGCGSNKDLQAGKDIVDKNCKVCHAQGINGAPILGNKVMWGPRLEKGVDTLATNATSGFGLMPAKGGATHLADEEIKLAVTYMASLIEDAN